MTKIEIKKDRKLVKLRDIVFITMGQSPPGISCNKKEEGYPLLNGPTEFKNISPIPIQYTTQGKKLSGKGDILFCVRGSSTGRMNISDQTYVIGRGLAAIRHKEGIEYQSFVKAIIEYYLPVLLGKSAGSTFPNIGRNDLENLSVSEFSLPEQNRIVSVLETWDKTLEKLNRKIELKKNIKKGLLQKLMTGKTRLPGFNGEWIYQKVGKVSKTSSGGTPKSTNLSYYQNGNIPWLKSGEVRKGKIQSFENFITKEGLTNSSAKLFPKETVLIAMYGATAGQVGYLLKEASTNQAICGLLPNEDVSSLFLYYFFTTKTNQLILLGSGAAQPNISQEIIREFDIYLPKSKEEQTAIANILTTADNEISALEKKRNLLAEQKKYLLNNLVTGKIRTPENLSL